MPSGSSAGSRTIAAAAARAAADKQAQDVVILDVHELIVITDYFVVCTGTSDRQVKTLVEEIEKALRALGEKPVRREGEQGSRWVLLDYVDVVVHVFAEEEREYYDLERLWRDAPRLRWDGEGEGVAASAD
ncbi:MAG TPA: ribosome silencing factor [Actinomycetota bacterium]|nr:ribosome silencing factor [Actinomycetota bacterium]